MTFIPHWSTLNFKITAQPSNVALRWAADAAQTLEQKAKDLLAQAEAYRELFSSLAFDEAEAEGIGS